MKFPLLVLFATGALSAPFFDISSFNYNFYEDDCTDPRLRDDATSIYTYSGETVNTVQGSTSDRTGLKLKAVIYIYPLGACKYRMQINNPELYVKSKNNEFQTAPESYKFAKELKAQDLVFKTSGGRINKLYPAAGESLHILNIKRGILSTLQLQKDAKEEVDVHGKCKVTVTEENGVITKVKDLAECSDRVHNEMGLQTATLEHSKMPIKPLNSKSVCEYVTKLGKIISVECEESHLFRPFSAGYNKPAGAITIVKQKLMLEKTKGMRQFAIETKAEGKPVSLIYGHEQETMKPEKSIISRIDSVMSSLVKMGSLSAKQSSAHEFVELVHLVRKLDSKSMRPVMDKYFNFDASDSNLKSSYKQFFLDALTYCGTPTCVSTVHDVIVNGQVSGESRNMFLQGISLVAKPTKMMIRDVLNIAKTMPSRQAFLSLGILMNRYCKLDAASCSYSKASPVTLAELFLESKLGSGCDDQDSYERVEEILMAIKAIGNAGQPVRVSDTLVKCAMTSKHMNITTAALDALRRMPCNERAQSSVLKMYEDLDMGVEKRIQAYLTAMNCPTESALTRIVTKLQGEQCKQVGSFVWSHIKNIQESSDPKNTRAQEILSKILKDVELKNFDLSFLKFSKAFETSVYSKYLKSGATVNGHLIYNPESFVPRSSLVSMSANILDVPVDVFEMAARIEGVESIAEDLFGPYGYFPDDKMMNFFNVNMKEEELEKLRSRRSSHQGYESTVNEIHEKVKRKSQPSGFLTMKVLGHEMRVFSYDDLQWAANEIDNMNVIEMLLKVAKGGHKTFSKSIMFLEMTHTVPTGVGLPLKLKLTGSAVGSLELDGKFDIRNMFWGPMALEVKGSIKPSAVVEVSGQMGVNSHYIDTGIFVNSSMYTSQVVKGTVLYREGQKLKINIDAPEEPIEFFNISSTPFTYVNEDIKLIEGTERRISPDFCMNSKMVLGLGLCTRLSVPVAFRDYDAPYYPLSGPASFGLKLVKADPKLTTYQFLVSLTKKQITAGTELIGTFQVGTPGATYSRGMSGSIKYKETNNVRELTIGSSEASRNAQLKITYQNNTNRFEVDFETDVFTSKPISTKFLYFNSTSYLSKEMGISMSASYDWYTLQHVTKFVKKQSPTKSFLLHTRTTYWPKKHLTGEIEYSPENGKVSIRFDSNQFKQRAEFDGTYTTTDTAMGYDFAFVYNSVKRISFYTGTVATAAEKKLVFNVKTPTSTPVELVWGYFVTGKGHEIKFIATAFGQKGELFAGYSNLRSGWHGVNVGGKFQDQVIGLSSSYNNEGSYQKDACIVAYLNEKRPAKTCLSLKDKELTWSAEVMKKTAALSFGLITSDGSYTLNSVLTVQGNELVKNTLDMTYKSLFNNELKWTMTSGKTTITSKVFTISNGDQLTLFGTEATGFGQFLKMQAKYSKLTEDDVTVRGIIVEGWVNKKLPISSTFLVETSERMYGIKSMFNAYDYSAKASFIYTLPKTSQHDFVTDVALTRKDFVILGSKTTENLIWDDAAKGYKLVWDLTAWNKKFSYGFDINYEDLSTDTKSEYAMVIGANFAKNKRSTLAAILSNTDAKTQLSVDVNYLPARQLQHQIVYYKGEKKLAVSIEFLPKMFVKLSGKVSKLDGWKLDTDLRFSWKNFEQTLNAAAAYVDEADLKGLNFKLSAFDQDFTVGSEYNSPQKALKTYVTVLGRTFQVVMRMDKALGIGSVVLGMEKITGNQQVMKELARAVLKFTKPDMSFEVHVGKANLFMITSILEETKGSFELTVMKKPIMKAVAVVDGDRATANIFALGRMLMQTVIRYNKEKQTALLSFDLLKKDMSIVFSGRWFSDLKQLRVATDFMGQSYGFDARFDPINYAAGFHVFFSKYRPGWSVSFDKEQNAVVFNMKLTPRLSANVVMKLTDDRIISLSVQRETEGQMVNEFTFKYELSSTASKFAFDWNKETVQQVKEMIIPLVKKAMEQAAEVFAKAKKLGETLSMETIQNVAQEALKMIREAEKKFDEFDFVAARDKLGEIIAQGMTKGAGLVQKGLELSSDGLMELHNKLPMVIKKMEAISLKTVDVSQYAMAEAEKMAKATYDSFKDIIHAGSPVVKLAWKLARNFEIQGKTTEQIATELVATMKAIIQSYKENMSMKMKLVIADMKKFVQSVKFPFTDAKIYDAVVEYIQKVKSIDFEMKARMIAKMIMNYELMNRQIKEYVNDIKQIMNNLPEELKTASVKLITFGRSQVKKITKVIMKLKKYFKPMMHCASKIAASTKRHFGPLVEKAVKKAKMALKAEFNKMYLPLEAAANKLWTVTKEFAMPLVKPLQPLYRDIKQQVRAIRLLEKEIGVVFDFYLQRMRDFIMTKYVTMYVKAANTAESYFIAAKKLTSMTLEEIAETTIDRSTEAVKAVAHFTKWVVGNRNKIVAAWKEDSMKAWAVVSDFAKIITSKPVKELVVQFLRYTESYSLTLVKELAHALKQTSQINVAVPMRQAWADMDLLKHLERYGLNKAISDVIENAKKINVADSVVNAVEKIEKAAQYLRRMYTNGLNELEIISKYIQSIPKKSFETWYLEVEAAAVGAQKTISAAVVKSFNEVARLSDKAVQMLMEFSKKVNKDYIAPLKQEYALLKQKAELVYDDVKDDCKVVYDIYKGIVYGVAKENYEKVKQALDTQYKKLYDDLTAFYKRYEDKTWEEIGMEIYGNSMQAYFDLVDMAKPRYDQAQKLAIKILRDAKENRDKIEKFVRENSFKFCQPAVMALYGKMTTYSKKVYNEMKKMSIAAYREMYTTVVKLYEDNKFLSIKQLTIKVKVAVEKMIQKYRGMIEKMTKENFANVKSFVMKLKSSFEKNVLPVLKEESVSVINQSLKATVAITEETVKAFKPQFIALKIKIGKYYVEAIALVEKVYKNAKETTMELYEKGYLALDLKIKKMLEGAKTLMKQIEEHPKFKELVQTEMFLESKKMLKKLSEFVAKRIEELKAKIEELRAHPKLAEIKRQVMDLKDHEAVKRITMALYTGKDSFLFTARKLQEKMQPHIKTLYNAAQAFPEYASQKVACFRADPVTCFWTDVAMLKSNLDKALSRDIKELVSIIVKTTKQIADDVTDENAKQLYQTFKNKGTQLYEELVKMIKTLPRDLKEKCTQFCDKQIKMLKEQFNKLVAQWKMSPLYPIFANEIWGEIAEEIITHEIVTELKNLAKYGVKEASLLYQKAAEYVTDFTKQTRMQIITKYNEIVQKFNQFIDETTLEDIVSKAKELHMTLVSEYLQKAKVLYYNALTALNAYQEKLVAYTMAKYATVKSYIENKYPEVMTQVKTQYSQYMKIAEEAYAKAMERTMELKNKAISKATKMWMESEIRGTVKKTLKMTVGETVAELMKIPGEAQKMYKDMTEMVISKYHVYLQPYVQKSVKTAKFVANEINETVVFVIKYYDFQGTALKGYKALLGAVPIVPVVAKEYAVKAGKISLKAVHSAFVYVDKLDLSMDKLKTTLEAVKSYVPDVRKYAKIQFSDSGVSLSFFHPEVTPSFRYHASKARKTIATYTKAVKAKTVAISNALLNELKARTMELRRDLNQSFLAHTRLGKRIGSIMQKTVLAKKGSVRKFFDISVRLWIGIANDIANKMKRTSRDWYALTKSAVLAILDSDSVSEAYEKTIIYLKQAGKKMEPYGKMIKNLAKFALRITRRSLDKVKPYYVALKESGVSYAYSMVVEDLRDVYEINMKRLYTVLSKIADAFLTKEDFKHVKSYMDIHAGILQKYGKRLFRFYKWNKLMLDRTIRKSKMQFLYKILSPLERRVDPFRTYAMIFGKRHVMTFDGMYYEFPKHPKSTCTYLLARDTVDGKFTILAQAETIIAETPEAKITIDKAGAVKGETKKTKAGITRREKLRGLPIETEGVTCKRYHHYIKCEFKRGVTLRCNVKHFMCTIELSGWHFGKSQGLLGTNNREMYDDMKLVSQKMTNSLEQLANSWLVTKSSECIAKESNNQAPMCSKAPSEKCLELFKSKSSPFAGYFDTVDPLPFLKTCQIDTADCDEDISHCDAVAAYRTAVKMQGFYPKNTKDCGSSKRGKPFTIKPKKAIDIVVVMSARKDAVQSKKTIASMMYNMDKKLFPFGYNTRYSLISYGAATKGKYGSRSHTFNGKFFTSGSKIATAIKNMAYVGRTNDINDYNEAILRATDLPFRNDAARVIVLFNFGKYVPSWFGPTSDETKYALKFKANASLFVFDDKVKLTDFQSGIFTPIGVTSKSVYRTPTLKIDSRIKPLPKTPFTRYIHRSGGLFVNDLPKSNEKVYTGALADAMIKDVREFQTTCKRCVSRWHGYVCLSDNTVTC